MQMKNTKLTNAFTGYKFVYDEKDKKFHNIYRDTDVGKGGYIYANPGIYGNVALLDIQSMHPASLIAMNCFGEYTSHFRDLRDARVAIKNGDFESARQMLGGKLAPYLNDESRAKDLAQALKIGINSVYGLTAAEFDNPMRDIRNKNNIVALRGALFMRTLQDEVESRGFKIVAIRTDSIKIADATKEIIGFCMEFASKYEYIFEHESTYDRICQINDADYVARYSSDESINGKNADKWTATGARFQHPYVFKKLFTKEPIEFDDMCETKEVSKSAMYLDKNEDLPDVTAYEKEHDKLMKDICDIELPQDAAIQAKCDRAEELSKLIEEGHNRIFVGKVGNFCPIKTGCGGGELIKRGKNKDGSYKYDSVNGAKGYRWLESEMVKELGKENDIDRSYYDNLVNDAWNAICQYGDAEWFVSDDPYVPQEPISPWTAPDDPNELPWKMTCGKDTCLGCPDLYVDAHHMDCNLGHNNADFISAHYEDPAELFSKR